MHYFKNKQLYENEDQLFTSLRQACKKWVYSKENSENEMFGHGYDFRAYMKLF